MRKLIQITDCHLLKDERELFCDISPDKNLLKILELAKQQNPDVLLLTGDLSQDASVESYQRLRCYLKSFGCPIYVIPGNHDERKMCLENLVSDNVYYQEVVDVDHWQLVFIDSVIPHETPGHLKQDQFDFLETQLKNGKDTVVCMHHHPVNISNFMDKYIINNFQVFQDFVKDKANLKLVIFGHIHADFHEKIHHVDFYGCPSTSVQFSLGGVENGNGIDALTPGFRVIELFEGGFRTRVVRV